MGARRHLPQWSEGKPTSFLSHDGTGEFAGSVERQPVFGVLGGRPQLQATLLECMTAPIAQLDDPIPLPGRTESVDEPDKGIEVAGGHRGGKISHGAAA